jgi:hypothetical protein
MLSKIKISLLDDSLKYITKKTYGKCTEEDLNKLLLKRSIIKSLEDCADVEDNSLSLEPTKYNCLTEAQYQELYNKVMTIC